MSKPKDVDRFVRATTAQSKIYTPTDARNAYELTKLVVRNEFNATEGTLLPGVSAASGESQGQPL
jgi:hypothetical protein